LAEHVRDSASTFNLTYLSERYHALGIYDAELAAWIAEHEDLVNDGFGLIPRDLINPYSAYDTIAPLMIAEQQVPTLRDMGGLTPRGPDGEYPSLVHTALRAQYCLHEIQKEGL